MSKSKEIVFLFSCIFLLYSFNICEYICGIYSYGYGSQSSQRWTYRRMIKLEECANIGRYCISRRNRFVSGLKTKAKNEYARIRFRLELIDIYVYSRVFHSSLIRNRQNSRRTIERQQITTKHPTILKYSSIRWLLLYIYIYIYIFF